MAFFFTFTTFVIQWKIDFRSTCCFRLKKTFFFLFGKKTERGKWKQHKVANRKLQMLHCIMQMLRLITAQKLKTFSYFPNATTSHTYTNSTYQNLIKTLSKTYFFHAICQIPLQKLFKESWKAIRIQMFSTFCDANFNKKRFFQSIQL